MKNKIVWLKITICAAFLAAFAAATFFSAATKNSAVKTFAAASTKAENPQNCAECHQANFASWHRSSHRKTVRKATVETVRGDFSGAHRLENARLKAEMIGGGANFFIKINDELYRIEAVVGTKYVEQYIGEKNGELHSLPVAYDLAQKRWMNLDETVFEKEAANFSAHSANFKPWKTECAACHRSGANDLTNDFGDHGIACAACHGNAAEHVAAKNSVWSQMGFETENKIVDPQSLSSDAAMLVCAECHARDLKVEPPFESGESESSGAKTDRLISAHSDDDAEKFWADGSSKFSGNEYQSIVRSVCYAQSKAGGHGIAGEKINCASCHSAHERDGGDAIAASEKNNNQNCVNCHTQFSETAAIAEHTKHPLDSAASNCASCHQPETVFARTRFTRTHEISVPDPVLTAEKQIPNACNLCHTDKSVNWAIAESKNLWTERFRAAEISADKQFDQPETIRALASNNEFLRSLAADSLRRHSDFNRSESFLNEAFRSETSPVVKSFLAAALQSNVLNRGENP